MDAPASPGGLDSLTLETHAIPQEYTTPLLDVKTDGERLVWSTGADASSRHAPDLYTFVPGDSAPQRVFENPNRDSLLLPVGTSGGRFAFAEQNSRVLGDHGWILWYVEAIGSEPVLIDQSDAPDVPGPKPLFALSGDRMVWTAMHDVAGSTHSQLLSVNLRTGEETVLQSHPADEVTFTFPSLHENLLVYGTVEGVGTVPERRVYLLALSRPEEVPARLDESGEAGMPVLWEATVVWKESPDNILNWGTLIRYSLSTGERERLEFGPQEAVNYPSVGRRYVAAWGIDATKFYLVDISTGAALRVAEFDPQATEVIVRPHLAGELLVWSYGPLDPDAPLELRWADLSE